MIGIVAFLLCGLIVSRSCPACRRCRMKARQHRSAASSHWRRSDCSRFSPAAFEQVLLSLFAVYGTALGSAEERIASLITCFIAGNAVLQILLGRVAEQFGSRWTMLSVPGFAGRLPAAAVDLQLVADLATRFRLGRVSFGIYTMSLIQLGERFTVKP